MPDDFGSYDEEVERRIMAYNVNPRPKVMVRPTFPPVKCHKPPSPCSFPKVEHEYIDEETELTIEIVKAAIKAGISHEIEDSSGNIHYIINNEMNRFRQSSIIEAIRRGTGWIGPG